MSSLKSVAFSCLAFTISSVSYAAGLSGLIPSIPPAPLPSPVGAPPFLVAAPLPAPAPSPITITTLRIAGVGDSANLNQVVKDQGKDTYLFYPVLQTAIWYAVDLGSPQEEVTLKFKLPSYLKIGTPTGFLLSGFTLVSYTSDAGGTVFEMKGTPTDPSVSGRLRATVDATAPADQRGVVSLTVTAKSGRTTALDVPAKVFEDLRFYVGGATVSNHGFAPLDFDPDDTNRVPVGVLNYRLAKTPDTMRQALLLGSDEHDVRLAYDENDGSFQSTGVVECRRARFRRHRRQYRNCADNARFSERSYGE